MKSYKDKLFFRVRIILVVVWFVFILPVTGYTQEENAYDEVLISLNVPRIGSSEIPAIIKGQDLYLPVKELFDFLKIKNTPSADFNSLTGFFINPKAVFSIHKDSSRIVYQEKTTNLQPTDLINTGTNLYLKSGFFEQVFGLHCPFDFRNLSVTVNAKIELPIIREMQQELLRKNVSQIKGEKKADTTMRQKFSRFQLGVADWSFTAAQQINGLSTTRASLAIGAMIAGGEAEANLNYFSDRPFSTGQQYFRWRYVNNEHSALRQITVGRIFTPSVSSLFAPVTGVQITNTPTTHRKSYGTYRLNSTTEPNWMVELYVNNILVNYTKADASGFFTFEVPVVYGNSAIKLRFYGPWGEERLREQNISIPFNFLPQRQFEYTATAGVVDDEEKSRFLRTNFNYGLNKRMTVGAGVEYLSSVTAGKPMPFVNASVRLGPGLLFSGEHTYGVRSKGTINYRLPLDMQLDVHYIKYEKDQTAFKFNYLEERKASLSVPFTGKKFAAFSRITYNRLTLPKSTYSNAEFLLSAIVHGVSTNLTTAAMYTDPAYPFLYSNLSLTFRFPHGIRFTPQAQYEYTTKNFSMVKGELEKRLSRFGFLNLSYEKNIKNKTGFVGLGVRLNFSFAQTSFSVLQGNKNTFLTQSARGSLLYNDKTNSLVINNQSNTGRGGLIILPFLDMNGNNRRDANEPKVAGLKLRLNGGRMEYNDADTTIRVVGLEAYASYFIELDKNSFDNIAWQLRKQSIRITVEPNHFNLIEVPVAVVGEASGMVYLQNGQDRRGLGRIIVAIYDSSSRLVARTLTESDGYFSYLGLMPGAFTARMDTAQLRNLNLHASPETINFTIASSKEGVVADGFAFTLRSLSDTPEQGSEAQQHTPALQHQQQTEMPIKQQLFMKNGLQSAAQEKPQLESQTKPQSVVPQKQKPGITNKLQSAVQQKQ